MVAVYILIIIIMVWYGSRPIGPSKPEPVPDDSKAWEEIINLAIAGTVLFWVLFFVFLWNR